MSRHRRGRIRGRRTYQVTLSNGTIAVYATRRPISHAVELRGADGTARVHSWHETVWDAQREANTRIYLGGAATVLPVR